MLARLVLIALCGAVIGSAFVVILVRWLLAPLVQEYADKAEEAAYHARQAAASVRSTYWIHGRPHDERMADDHEPYGGDQGHAGDPPHGSRHSAWEPRHFWRD